jgi:hypothetical protein
MGTIKEKTSRIYMLVKVTRQYFGAKKLNQYSNGS